MDLDNTFSKNEKAWFLILMLIIGIAAIMRLKGAWFGFPLPVHPDEPRLVETALNMLKTGDLNPHFFNYPSLNMYIHAGLYGLSNLISNAIGIPLADKPIIWYYIIGRIFNVLLSVSTIYVTFVIGWRLFSPLTGVLAAFFLTFSFLHATNSYLATVDTTVAFWAVLATLMSVLIYTQEKKLIYYILGGIFVGLATSSKYTAFLCMAPILVAHLSRSKNSKEWIDKNIVLCAVVVPIVFLATTPYAFLDHEKFISALEFEAHHYRSGHAGAESSTNTSYNMYASFLLLEGYGVIPLIFSIFGFMWLAIKDYWKAALLSLFPILLIMFVGNYKVYFPRNIVAVTPFLALFSGLFLTVIYTKLDNVASLYFKQNITLISYTVLITILLVGIWQQSSSTINHIAKITRPDTRWVSLEWVKSSLPAGSVIGREHYTPPLEQWTNKFSSKYLGGGAVIKHKKTITTLDYMIVSEGDYGRYVNHPSDYPKEAKMYNDFFNQHELIKEFNPTRDHLGGPIVRIYKISSK